ncbi:NUDIX domain-containing protein [Xinfangfangia sp. D13-10-4-6]|nr:NUDIX domain-containing protein [Pseudogemmobacter hezensis]
MSAFTGAKAALFLSDGSGARLLTLQRDVHPGLPWPGHWDLPGGGREGDETAEACLLRELHEEFGLSLSPARLEHRFVFPAMNPGPAMSALPAVFFAGWITEAEIAQIRFGDEGQGWQMMALADYLAHPLAIPALCTRLRHVAPCLGISL